MAHRRATIRRTHRDGPPPWPPGSAPGARRYHGPPVQLTGVSPRAFLRIAQTTVGLVVLNVVTGAAVRLTDSGLGCPDWPTCSEHHLTPPLSFHPVVEFANRLVVVVLCIGAGVALVAAWRRVPRRRDLLWLSGGLLGGVVAEAVIGGVVVYTKLNPYVVMTHFMVGIALLTDATVLALRAGRAPGRAGPPKVGRGTVRLSRVTLGLLAVALVAGTATTGAGPHAGGKGAKRIPVPLVDMARVHSGIVLAVVGLTVVVLWLLVRGRAPASVLDRARLLLGAMVAQGVIGYTQYFSHLPALLVGVHEFGATVVWVAMLWFVDGLWHRAAEDAPAPASPRPGSWWAGERPRPRRPPRRGRGPRKRRRRPPRPALAGHRVERPHQLHVLRDVRVPEALRLQPRQGHQAHARRPPQGTGGGELGAPGAGRAGRVPAARARPVGDHGGVGMIRHRRFGRDRQGRIRPGLEPTERDLLRMLPAQARELVDTEEPSAQRLFPVAYPDNDESQAEYRSMMGGQLLEHHRHALDALAASVDDDTVDEDQLSVWLGAVEVLRLLLGTQLDVSEDHVTVLPDDPRAEQFTVYQYLSMLQGEIVDALARGLPRSTSA